MVRHGGSGPERLRRTGARAAGGGTRPGGRCAGGPAWQRVHLGSGAVVYDFPVYANHPLDGDLRGIREVVFVQHGRQRNGNDYYPPAPSC